MPRNQSGTRNGVAGRYDQYGDFYANKPAVMPVTSQDWVRAKALGDTPKMESIKKSLIGQQEKLYGARQPAVMPNNSNNSIMSGNETQEFKADYDVEGRINTLFNEMQSGNADAEKELMELAKSDYDLVAKWIEKAYTNAAGTDDVARQEFIKKVSNDLESKIGTFAFDYETGTYRNNEDLGITKEQLGYEKDTGLKRLGEDTGVVQEGLDYNKNTALKRLAEDDTTYRTQIGKQAGTERTSQEELLNQRGLLTGTRDKTQGVGSTDVTRLEGDIQDRFDALSRATGRTGEDVNRNYTTGTAANQLGFGRGTEDINRYYNTNLSAAELANSRTNEDLTTTARRGLIGATDTRNSGIEQAEQRKRAEELRIQQEKKRADDQAKIIAQQQAEREARNYYGS